LNRRRQFSLLLVRGDGDRIVRLDLFHPVALALLGTLVLVSVGVLIGDYVGGGWLTRGAHALSRQVAEQRVTLDAVSRRIADLRGEMAAWRALHARISEPFGVEAAPAAAERGMARVPATPPASPADELERLARSVREESESLKALDRLIARAGRALAMIPSRWPLVGPVNSEFGARRSLGGDGSEFHGGIDIGAERGTPLQAPAAGTVAFAGSQADYGLSVVIDHGQDVRSVYGHLSRVAVKPGDRVERGTVIGATGNTGRTSGPHLHYEVRVSGRRVNPRTFLWH
jgi:septal ring factor EnvC (AmiA/AmiB activator)